MQVSGFTFIRNAAKFDYPVVEAITSLLPLCDEFVVMLGNSDIKDEQNVTYKLKEPFEGASRWYVARDLGQSFGRTGVLDAPRATSRSSRTRRSSRGWPAPTSASTGVAGTARWSIA